MKKATWLTPYRFQPEIYERELRTIIREIDRCARLGEADLNRILRETPKDGRQYFSKSEIIQGYHYLAGREEVYGQAEAFLEKLRMKPVRTLSGVTPVTVLTKPFPCPGQCIFCPNDVRMPKSYLSREPGAQRAAQHAFDPYEQTYSRLNALHRMGHPVDKVELIVLGGTWSFYPEGYQIWFVGRCFEAMNDFGRGELAETSGRHRVDYQELEERIDGRFESNPYNEIVSSFLRSMEDGELVGVSEASSWTELHRVHLENETGRHRCVGLSVETRPDYVSEAEVERMRRLGATKVQIGIQSLSDDVLSANKRGHDVATTRRAVRLLRQAGFKVQAHWMPNLYGSSPQRDIEDFERLFSDADFRPDEVKIYPCSLIESAELMVPYRAGKWSPYSQDELLEVLVACLERVPGYCRVSRVIRDIPGDDILEGNKITNFRGVAESELRRRGLQCRDIRSREIRSAPVRLENLRRKELRYRSSNGEEVFLQFADGDDRIAAFLRLALPSEESFLDEIRASAVIREVHVYGAAASLGEKNGLKAQHTGLGRRLVERAETIAGQAGYSSLAVISSVGTRAYYRRLGFQDGPLYQHKSLTD
jgi:elongator complex protein 3 (tRNA carboxymethyluridine synthase)